MIRGSTHCRFVTGIDRSLSLSLSLEKRYPTWEKMQRSRIEVCGGPIPVEALLQGLEFQQFLHLREFA